MTILISRRGCNECKLAYEAVTAGDAGRRKLLLQMQRSLKLTTFRLITSKVFLRGEKAGVQRLLLPHAQGHAYGHLF